MLQQFESAVEPVRQDKALRLACSEEWGGNRMIDAPIQLPGIRGRIYSRPCGGRRGGDVHYLAVCGAGLLSRLWVSDVVGHGETVAKVSGETHELLRRYMNQDDQRRVLENLNRRLTRIGLGAMTTAAAATYSAMQRQLSVSYAGHPPGWFYESATDQWTRLVSSRPEKRPAILTDGPLAVVADAEFTRLDRKVSVGDRLLLLTDGVLEAPNGAGGLYGTEPLEKLLAEHRRDELGQIADAVISDITRRAGAAGLTHDDVTLLAVEFVPGPRPPAMWHALKNMVRRPRGNADDPAFADPPR